MFVEVGLQPHQKVYENSTLSKNGPVKSTETKAETKASKKTTLLWNDGRKERKKATEMKECKKTTLQM